MRLYLDVCCLNRPFDDPKQERVRLEAEAVSAIVARCRTRAWRLISSEAVVYEIAQTPDPQRRALLLALVAGAAEVVPLTAAALRSARDLQGAGLHRLDALHLALAAAGRAEVFLTTDRRILKLAGRLPQEGFPALRNPLAWLLEVAPR